MSVRSLFQITAIGLCIVLAFLAGSFRGYTFGVTEYAGFGFGGESGYDLIAYSYNQICACVLLAVVLGLGKGMPWLRLLSFFALILALVPIRSIYLQKALYFSDDQTITALMRNAVYWDLACGLFYLFLVSVSAYRVVSEFKDSRVKIE